MANTIYALATPFAKSAIAILRVSGPSALVSLKLFSNSKIFPHGKMVLTTLSFNNEIIDKCFVVYFNGSKSYTGEDLVEYYIHGSRAIIKELYEILSTIVDHKIAEPGEFTKRALLNNKIDLIKAEGISDLVNAETKKQKKQAIRSLEGSVGSIYESWYQVLKESLALLEASIDFSDQDLPDNLIKQVSNNVLKVKDAINKELTLLPKAYKIREGFQITILGPPNVGKSSLINYLLKKDVAIVSEISGTTRDVIDAVLDIDGFAVTVSDTAGLRETEDLIEKEGIKRALASAQSSDILLIVLDINKLDEYEEEIKAIVNKNSIILLNKSDICENGNIKTKFTNEYYCISLITGKGLKDFEEALSKKLILLSGINENPTIVNYRHKELCLTVVKELESFAYTEDVVIMSFYLRNAMNSLGRILGRVDIEEILGLIFANFCIGK